MKSASDRFPPDVVVAGYLGVDIAPGFPAGRPPIPAAELFRPGRLVETEGLSFSLGGVVANTGLAMKRFGQKVGLMGTVGCDPLGDIVMSQLETHGVTGGIRRNPGSGTAYGIVIAPPGMDRIFFEDPGCNAVFTAKDIDYPTVAQSRLFHFGYPPLMRAMCAANGAELRKMLQKVRSLGVATSLDLALPDSDSPDGKSDWRGILSAILPHVDIFVPSVEEILLMLEPERYACLLAAAAGGDIVDIVPLDLFDRVADRILDLGVKVLMIKSGHRGAYFRTGDVAALGTPLELSSGNWSNRKLWIDSFRAEPARIKNACGAGDCAVAGFLTALLRGAEMEKAAGYAMLAGRDNLYGIDAFSGLSDWDEMTAALHPRDASSRRDSVKKQPSSVNSRNDNPGAGG